MSKKSDEEYDEDCYKKRMDAFLSYHRLLMGKWVVKRKQIIDATRMSFAYSLLHCAFHEMYNLYEDTELAHKRISEFLEVYDEDLEIYNEALKEKTIDNLNE